MPAVNQIELHPGFQQAELRAFHAEHGIVDGGVEPAGPGRRSHRSGRRRGRRSARQDAGSGGLRWHLSWAMS